MRSRHLWLASLSSYTLAALSLHAGSAVSSQNARLSYSYDRFEFGNYAQTLSGSLALPISRNIGVQVNANYGSFNADDDDFYGESLALFWRDSDLGLVGVSGGASALPPYASSKGANVFATYYYRWLTPEVSLSYSRSDYDYPFFSHETTTRSLALSLGMYPMPDLRVTPFFRRSVTTTFGLSDFTNYYGVGAEYEVPRVNVTLSAAASRNDHGADHYTFAISYYFGGLKSLKARHREDLL